MVIRGGENIYPREVEEYLYGHPDIQDVQVFGVPDTKYGEEICAWIVTRAGASIDEEGVRRFCQDRISHYKIPTLYPLRREFSVNRNRQGSEVCNARSDDRGIRPRRTRT